MKPVQYINIKQLLTIWIFLLGSVKFILLLIRGRALCIWSNFSYFCDAVIQILGCV